jgi:deoxycytidylate deaminase
MIEQSKPNPIKCETYKLIESINILKKKAQNSDLQFKHSACLIKGNKICAIGINKYIKDIIINDNIKGKTTIHAEIDAIINSNSKNMKGIDILIIRLGQSNNLQNSRPCNSCIEKMRKKGIRKAYYSNEFGEIVYEFIDHMPKIHISSGNLFKKRNNIN